MRSNQGTEKLLLLGLVLVITALVGVVYIGQRQTLRVENSVSNLQRTNEILLTSDRLLVKAINIETGARGFALTGDEKFLEPIRQSEKQIDVELLLLSNLMYDQPSLLFFVDSLDYYIRKRIEFSERQIEVRKNKGLVEAAKLATTGEGKMYLDKVRIYTDRIQSEGKQLLKAKEIKSKKTFSFLSSLLLVLMTLAILLAAIFSIYAWQYFKKGQQQRDQLTIFNTKLKEEVTQKTNELYNILERLTDSFITVDNNWCYTYMNKKAGEALNRDPDKMIGKSLWEEFPESVGTSFYDSAMRAMKEQVYIHQEEYYSPVSKWFENHIYPSPTGMSFFFTDITERKNAEEALKLSEERYRVLVEEAGDGIFIANTSGRMLSANKKGTEMIGYTAEELTGLDISDLISPENLQRNPFKMAQLLAGETVVSERVLKRKDGTTIIADIKKTALTDNRLLFIMRDITYRVRAAEEINEKAHQLQILGDNLPETMIYQMVLMPSGQKKFTYVSKSVTKLTGKEPEELIKDSTILYNIIVEEDRHNFLNAEMLATQAMSVFKAEVRVNSFSDGVRWLSVRSTPRKLADGSIVWDGIHTDITEQKRKEQQIEQANKNLELAEEQAQLGSWEYDAVSLKGGWSKQMFRLFGFDIGKEPPPIQDYLERIHPQDRHFVIDAMKEMSEGKTPIPNVFRTNPEILPLRYLLPSRYALNNESGKPIKFSGTLADITKQKQAEEQIIREKELSDSLINSLPGVFYLYDTTGKFLRWNKNFETVTGCSHSDMEKSHPLDFFDADEKELLAQKIASVFDNGEDNVEANFVTKSGNKIPYFFNGRTIEYENQQCLMGMGIDISERKIAEKKLKDSENKYRILFEDNPLPLWIYSLKDLRFLEVNEAAIRHYGYSKSEFLEMTLKDIRPTEDVEQLLAAEKTDYRKIYHAGQWRHLKKDGTIINVEIVTHDTEYAGEHVRLVLANDVTEKLKAEQNMLELLESVRRLSAHQQNIREEERKRIAREIHDDLGQQLTAIKMDIAWIDKHIPEAETRFKEKLKGTIALLDGSNLSLRKILSELRTGIVDANNIADALDLLGRNFSAKTGIRFSFNRTGQVIAADIPVVNCLFRILQESLTNITRHAKASNVILALWTEQDSIYMQVKDDGVGFKVSDLQKKESFGILGMRERVASLNGVFEMKSSAEEGSIVQVIIPLKAKNKKDSYENSNHS